jgi:hypothetical protein
LHGLIFEDLCIQQPLGMAYPQHPTQRMQTTKSFLRPRTSTTFWFNRFSSFFF